MEKLGSFVKGSFSTSSILSAGFSLNNGKVWHLWQDFSLDRYVHARVTGNMRKGATRATKAALKANLGSLISLEPSFNSATKR